MSKTMRVPSPLAVEGDAIRVGNYRSLGRWEEGTVRRVTATLSPHGGFRWSYEVRIERAEHTTTRGRVRTGYTITVGDEAVRR